MFPRRRWLARWLALCCLISVRFAAGQSPQGLFRPFQATVAQEVDDQVVPVPRGRYQLKGSPLRTTSWRNRPLYAAVLLGTALGDELIPGHVEQHSTFMGGLWLGHDFSHYWGGEMRLAMAYPAISTVGNSTGPTGRQEWWDMQILAYPWGDTRFRPYYKFGAGITGVHFQDEQGTYYNRGLATLPLGFGAKYLWRKHIAVRLDVTDTIAFGSGAVRTMHQWSILLGFEARFGSGTQVLFSH